jgi:hypothetical protein
MDKNVLFQDHGVRVGPSGNGLGVFSVRAFAVREALGPIEGQIFDDDSHESDYCMELGENGCIEPNAPFRFLNHSCEPNCSLQEFEIEQEDGTSVGQLWLSVDAEIEPGEQMTIDYGWPAEHAEPCRCGSTKCRNWIVAAEDIAKVTYAHKC